MTTSDAMQAQTVEIQGHNGDQIPAYFARPSGNGPYPGVVVIHHMPGYDEATKEIVRNFAAHGYVAICPNLHHRAAPGAGAADAAAATRDAGGVPDDRCIGDVDGAAGYLRSQSYSNGKVGVIGYCSGGRQVYLVACNLPHLDAAVNCYGGRVVVTPDQLTPQTPVPVIDMTPNLACPMLGLFGADDRNPDPEQVAHIEVELKRHGKTYEFHTYEGAGHAFFSVDRPAYRPEAAMDGWEKIFAFYEKHLRG